MEDSKRVLTVMGGDKTLVGEHNVIHKLCVIELYTTGSVVQLEHCLDTQNVWVRFPILPIGAHT